MKASSLLRLCLAGLVGLLLLTMPLAAAPGRHRHQISERHLRWMRRHHHSRHHHAIPHRLPPARTHTALKHMTRKAMHRHVVETMPPPPPPGRPRYMPPNKPAPGPGH